MFPAEEMALSLLLDDCHTGCLREACPVGERHERTVFPIASHVEGAGAEVVCARHIHVSSRENNLTGRRIRWAVAQLCERAVIPIQRRTIALRRIPGDVYVRPVDK